MADARRCLQLPSIHQYDQQLRDLCAAFQRRVVDSLLDKALAASQREGIPHVVLAGGVAANSDLRQRGSERLARHGVKLTVPSRRACTDNAAMIAYAGAYARLLGQDDRGRLEISPKTSLPRATRKGGGRR